MASDRINLHYMNSRFVPTIRWVGVEGQFHMAQTYFVNCLLFRINIDFLNMVSLHKNLKKKLKT